MYTATNQNTALIGKSYYSKIFTPFKSTIQLLILRMSCDTGNIQKTGAHEKMAPAGKDITIK